MPASLIDRHTYIWQDDSTVFPVELEQALHIKLSFKRLLSPGIKIFAGKAFLAHVRKNRHPALVYCEADYLVHLTW